MTIFHGEIHSSYSRGEVIIEVINLIICGSTVIEYISSFYVELCSMYPIVYLVINHCLTSSPSVSKLYAGRILNHFVMTFHSDRQRHKAELGFVLDLIMCVRNVTLSRIPASLRVSGVISSFEHSLDSFTSSMSSSETSVLKYKNEVEFTCVNIELGAPNCFHIYQSNYILGYN